MSISRAQRRPASMSHNQTEPSDDPLNTRHGIPPAPPTPPALPPAAEPSAAASATTGLEWARALAPVEEHASTPGAPAMTPMPPSPPSPPSPPPPPCTAIPWPYLTGRSRATASCCDAPRVAGPNLPAHMSIAPSGLFLERPVSEDASRDASPDASPDVSPDAYADTSHSRSVRSAPALRR
eukprot:scaffold24654_cov101-Isochrysis_galbana.AAC.6